MSAARQRTDARIPPIRAILTGARTRQSRDSSVIPGLVIIASLLMLVVALVAWLTQAANGPSLADCRVYPSVLGLAPRIDATMRIRGDITCPISIEAVAGSIRSMQLTTSPENGVVTFDAAGVSYRPSPDFTGRDFFSFAMRGQSARFEGTSVARVHVFVR